MKDTPIRQYLKDNPNNDETIYEILKRYEKYRFEIESNGYKPRTYEYAHAKAIAENWREIATRLVYGIFTEDDMKENIDVMQSICEFLGISYNCDWFIPR